MTETQTNLSLKTDPEPAADSPAIAGEAAATTEDVFVFPVSFAQQRLWFLQQMEPEGATYNVPVATRLKGRLDTSVLEQTLREIIRRHESLRTTFDIVEGEPVQLISEHFGLALPIEDLSQLPAAEREEAARRLSNEEVRKPFDLSKGPLLRARLLRLDEDDHVLLVTLHHIISDGWSMGVLVGEVATLYRAYAEGEESPLAELPLQYADYAQWQREWLQGDALEAQLDYWRRQLKGAPPVLELPTDRPRPPVQSFRGAQETFALSESLSDELRKLCAREGATLYMLLLAAFQTLLHRYTNQTDIVVGTPIAGRNRSELEGLIGFFINTLVLRADVSGNPTFRELLGRVREVALGAYAHQDVPFEKLVEEFQTERDLSHMPLVQVLFALQNTPEKEAVELPGLTLAGVEADNGTARFDLSFNVWESGRTIEGFMRYKTELFDASTVRRMLSHFRNLLVGVALRPDRRISELPLLDDEERAQLQNWNATRADYPSEQTLHALFEAQAERTPDSIALIFERESISYRELNRRANRLANHLRCRVGRRDTLVAVCAERSVELVVGLLAVLKAGGAYVPIDPAYPHERIAFMLEDARPRLLLTQERLLASLPRGEAEVFRLDADREKVASEDEGNPQVRVAPENLAYMIYTSGSTGKPKGALNTHAAICNRLLWMQDAYRLDSSDRVLQKTPYSFDVSVWEFFWPLLTGARLVVARPGGHQDSAYLVELVEREQITTLHFVPSMLQLFLAERDLRRRCASLRRVLCSGEALPFELQQKFFAHLDTELHNLYGPTEAAVDVTFWQCERDSTRPLVPIGRPIANVEIQLLDPYLNQLPIGIAGELYIGGAGLARGYLNRPELTAERFIPNPFGEAIGERLYRTGDLARRLADGEIEFLGRVDYQVKIRGFRIELGEIEAALVAHEGVGECQVLAREDAPGDKRLVAYIVARETSATSAGELREFLQARLPEYMIPSAFVSLDAFPLTPNGKVDRRALPAPGAARPELRQTYVAPRNGLETMLVEMWRETLGIERIGVEDNFFELGGDSIKGAIFINRLQETLGQIIHVVVIFTSPTVAQLAAYLREHYREAVSKIEGAEPASGSVEASTSEAQAPAKPLDEEMLDAARRLIKPLQPRAKVKASVSKNPPAVFVLSPPRSGSTLLRVMLAGHPALFAPPELELLSFNTLAERRAAFSGAQAFWLEGALRALLEAHGVGTDEAGNIMREYEERGLTTQEFYRELQSAIGSRRLVDKTPSYAMDGRILERAEEDFDGALYVHLLRHPSAMIHSFEEARMDQVFFRYEHSFSTREVAEIIWTISHRNILAFLKGVPRERQHRVVFEELVGRPRETLESLCRFLGVELHPEMLEPYREKARRMTDGLHKESRMLGDVKFHSHASIDAGVARCWEQKRDAFALGEPTVRLAGLLGYEVPKAFEGGAGEHPSSEQFEWKLAVSSSMPERSLAIPRVARETVEPLPLSFAQQRLFFLDRIVPRKSAYNIPLAVRVRGALDVEALQRSLHELVRRHESLRTSFPLVGGEPAQRIEPRAFVALLAMDLSQYAEAEREERLRRIATEEARLHFDLKRGPLFRSNLLKLAEDDHALIFNMHHIISDGWSIGILIRELATLYDAFAAGKPSPLEELPVQYADFAVWQRGWLTGEGLALQLDYWREKLSGASVLQLPTDRPRPPAQTFPGANSRRVLPPQLSAALQDLCRREGATLYMLLLAAFQTLLHRYTNQTDIVVGTPIAGRNHAEIENLIGFFVNTLVLRTDVSGNPTFRELLGRVREVALGAYAHQDVPFEKLVEELNVERDPSRTPLFQVLFAMQNAPRPELKLDAGLSFDAVEIEGGAAKFDLSLTFQETAAGLVANVEYNTDLFDASTAERMLRHLEILLEAVVANPDERISAVTILTGEERARTQATPYQESLQDGSATIQELFERQVEKTPDAVALISGDERISYGELNARANRLARYLRSSGVGAETLVGILSGRSTEMVVALLAVLKAGGAYVPLDPQYPQERIAFMLEDASVSVLITERALVERLPAHAARVVLLDEPEVFSSESAENLNAKVAGENLAYVIYTSGSTGRPKGVAIVHRSAVELLRWASTQFNEAELSGVLASTSICFDLSIFELFAPLSTGGKIVLAENALALAELRAADEVTLINTVPSAMAELVRVGGLPASVRTVNLAGEPLKQALVRQVYRHEHVERVVNLYGPSEDTTYSTVAVQPRGAKHEPTIGRPITNTEVFVLDEHLQLVPVGVAGELYIGGSGLARGYLNRPELTAERFIPNPFGEAIGERLYRTGDLARRLADGEIEFLGRVDYQVKIRGFRIELGEIEAAIGRNAGVGEAVVLAREDAPGDRRLVAYAVAREGASLSVEELRGYLKTKLPEYMIPSAFVVLDAFPLTPNGKIDRKALPAPATERDEASSTFVAPRNEQEAQLARLWEEVLQVRLVGVRDNFFDLGGHSLLAVKLFSRIEEETGSTLPLSTLFESATVESQVKMLRSRVAARTETSLVPIQPRGSRPPLFCAHSWGGNVLAYKELSRRLGEDQPVYGFQARGVERKENPHRSIQEMAAAYLSELRGVQPKGPYQICGWSSGGLIAFEMAQQLEEQGEHVGLLALVDSYDPTPNFIRAGRGETLARRASAFVTLAQITTYTGQTVFANVRYDEEVGVYYKAPASLGLGQSRQYLREYVDYYLHFDRAIKSYLPRPFGGRVLHFWTPGTIAKAKPAALEAWRELARGGFEIEEVPGEHFTILKEPNVGVLAEKLAERLSQT
ncbi:MAG TPA: amino acid adenylation domain-containing protein [Pyrinomonadaceae bacterium]|jgi:amino acid adenylation domain-containing protein